MRTSMNLIGLLAAAGSAVVSACVPPATPLPDTILEPFRIQYQNTSYPAVHKLHLNAGLAGGGDRHLFTDPVGDKIFNMTLVDGAITNTWAEGTLRAVIGGEHSTIDNTDKIFMTNRGDPVAVFKPTWGCDPDTDQPQVELVFQGHRKGSTFVPGGWYCIRPTYDGAYESRYYPPGNTANDPNKFCVKVTLVALVSQAPVASTTTQTSTTSATTTVTTSSTLPTTTQTTTTSATTTVTTASPTTLSTVTTTGPANPSATGKFTDMTAQGYAFQGCAPEERTANDEPGRTLGGPRFSADDMTNEKCFEFCAARGYKLAGTEYRRECYCGNALFRPTRQPATTVASLAGCSYPCAGNAAQFCGGSAWLSLYRKCEAGETCVNAQFT
ncbi:hypothetical protein GGTG_05940 [Gaeumannomyces tritici R3-111a-1]|uniref:WSC domain-containing protein n=1 Tax=Gaeumannomyces tritici (strain R3-111a-1) TaxID=644352 RepID=J3NXD3_GAET3|nr:hypothetical protein GGTG_05940 [Gaeumannomyces tritici R3-111a-1]EJT76015.1 hypothetical protein GGTG_05940 [Gaeumannomyces tritici R3-111a-1]